MDRLNTGQWTGYWHAGKCKLDWILYPVQGAIILNTGSLNWIMAHWTGYWLTYNTGQEKGN